MRIVRKLFHIPFIKWLFTKTRLWVPFVFLAGWARLGWILGFPAYAAPILLHTVIQRGVFGLADRVSQQFGNVAGGLVELLLYWPLTTVLIVMLLDLAWLAITAPKQVLLGSLFASERTEEDNQRHLAYLDRSANASIGGPFE